MSGLEALPVPPPGACAPRALGRLLGLIAQGHAEPTTLARRLRQVEGVVRERIALATWLGLLRSARPGEAPQVESAGRAAAEAPPLLTRRGLEFLFGTRRRAQAYADLLWEHPVLGPLMAGRQGAPFEASELQRTLAQALPGLPPPRLAQIAGSLIDILAPAGHRRPKRRERRAGQQLRLALARPRPPVTGYRFKPIGADTQAEDPAVYRALLQALLDEGEIAVAQVGRLLSGLDLPEAAAGACVEMAIRRGDARRCHVARTDQLVVTAAAVRRRDLSDTVATVALSDPEYRAYLEVLQATGRGDMGAGVRYGRLRSRFARWDARVFGEDLAPRALAQAADKLLRGRMLEAIPPAVSEPEPEPLGPPLPFLEALDHRSLIVALPPSIDLLVGGLGAVSQALDALRGGRPVPAFQARFRVHGGLLSPGEAPPPSLPDRVSLRLHAVERVPHLALLVALLLEQRLGGFRVALRVRGDRLRVMHRRRDLGDFLTRADDLMRERGWLVSRRLRGGLSEASLVDIAEALGIVALAGHAVVLGEPFFARLLRQPEDRPVFERLRPFGAWIGERLAEWAVGVEPAPVEQAP